MRWRSRVPDPEGVYQMRVALRRLRTICALFRRDIPSPAFQAVNGEAKWLMQQLGPARDWDAFVETTVTLAVVRGGSRCRPRCLAPGGRTAAQIELRFSRCMPFSPIRVAAGSCSRWGKKWNAAAGATRSTETPWPCSRNLDGDAIRIKFSTRLHRKAFKRGAHFRQLDRR